MFCVVLLSLLIDISQCLVLDENSNKLYDLVWQCDTVCLGSGGTAEFDSKNKTCKCTVDINADNIDVELMKKTAKNLGLQIITCNGYKELQKRDTNQNTDIDEDIIQKEDRDVVNPSRFLSSLDRPLFNKADSPVNKFVLSRSNTFPLIKSTEKLRDNKDKDRKHLTTRLLDILKEQKEKIEHMLEKNEAKILKSRSSFKSSNAEIPLDTANKKQKSFMDQYLNRRAKLLNHSFFSKKRNNSDNENPLHQAKPQQNLGISTAQRTSTAPIKGLILQPIDTYDENTK